MTNANNANIEHVAILGGGVAAWMSAAFLGQMLGTKVKVTVVDQGGGEDAAFVGSSMPPIKAFHGALGLAETDLLAKTQGSMKLGTQFVNWGQLGNRYFHPYGSFGAEFDAVPLHQWWLKEKLEQPEVGGLESLSLAQALAANGNFTHPVGDRRMIQSTIDYAYHFDGALYHDQLKARAIGLGVNHLTTSAVQVVLKEGDGFVEALTLDDGSQIAADLFLDCSGREGLLIGDALGTQFHDWSALLPCDRAVSISCAKGNEFAPSSRNVARDAGWQWRVPLQHETRNGYAYASQYCSDDDASAVLLENLDGRALGEPKFASFTNGRRANCFVKNVVAIGDAAGFLEPLEATSLQLIQSSLTRLLALWPTKAFAPVIADEYNAITNQDWDLARDFLVLHYHQSTRSDSPFWRARREAAIPETLQHRLAHWAAAARLVSPGPEVFQQASWLAVLVGQGDLPSLLDPLVDARADRVDYKAQLASLRKVIADTGAAMPSHRDWIDKNARGARN